MGGKVQRDVAAVAGLAVVPQNQTVLNVAGGLTHNTIYVTNVSFEMGYADEIAQLAGDAPKWRKLGHPTVMQALFIVLTSPRWGQLGRVSGELRFGAPAAPLNTKTLWHCNAWAANGTCTTPAQVNAAPAGNINIVNNDSGRYTRPIAGTPDRDETKLQHVVEKLHTQDGTDWYWQKVL
jgi:hypothetical protein